MSVRQTTLRIDIDECKIRVGTCIPAARVQAGGIFWVMEWDKMVGTCPAKQAFPICTVAIIIPINILAIKVANIATGMWEY